MLTRRALLATLAAAACGRRAAPAPEPLAVAAASDLRFALDEVVARFHALRPGARVRVAYGSSGSYYAQLVAGAPYDLFLSADVRYPERLNEARLALDGRVFRYGVGRLALVVPRASPLDPARDGLRALASPAVRRVAIANPRHAPYGRAAEAALRASGLHDVVSPKLVLGENVAQAAQFVETGAADAGLVALSLARSPSLAARTRHGEVPAALHPRLDQGGIVLRRTAHPAAARALAAFLTGPEARAVLLRYGFAPPEP